MRELKDPIRQGTRNMRNQRYWELEKRNRHLSPIPTLYKLDLRGPWWRTLMLYCSTLLLCPIRVLHLGKAWSSKIKRENISVLKYISALFSIKIKQKVENRLTNRITVLRGDTIRGVTIAIFHLKIAVMKNSPFVASKSYSIHNFSYRETT